MGISIKMIRFCLEQAYIALAGRVELQTQFSRCETLLRIYEHSELSSEHETRPSLSHHQNMFKIWTS